MKKNILILGSIVLVAFSALIFIHFSNDHIECEVISNSETTSDGDIVITEQHICNEKYNF